MNKQQEITSTEKLLDVIRKRQRDILPPVPDQGGAVTLRRRGLSRFHSPAIISLQKTPTIGVDIGHDYLRMVRASRSPGGHWQIEDRRRWDIPAHLSKDGSEFGEFLKTALDAVIGSSKQVKLWSIMSAARVDVRNVRIPKLPKKQIANAVYWTLKKEAPFDEREMIFDFELQGEIIEQGIPKLAVMVYTAPRQEIEDLKSIFARIGHPLTGISIVPFAVQNLFRSGWIPALEGSIANLFIGNDFSRIDIYAGGNLVMTRGIKTGTSSMVEVLVERCNELHKVPGAPPLTMEQGLEIVCSLSPDSPSLKETDAGFTLPKEDVYEMIQPALERLVRQVERTFEHYVTTGNREKISKIFVSSSMNIYRPIVDYVGNQLGVDSAILDPLSMQDPVPCPDVDDAQCISKRVAFAPALGLALSDNERTPNLIFTYKDKGRAAGITLINRVIFASFFVVALIFTAVFVYQNLAIMGKKADIAKLEAQLAQLGPAVDRDQLMKMTAKVSERRKLSKVYADRYLGMVLISELAALTPANIRFLNLKISLGPAATQGAAKPAPAAGAPPAAGMAATQVEEVTVEGLIFGDRQTFESALAGYAMLLEASPILRQVTIKKNTVGPYLKGEALNFILNMKVEEQVHG